MDKLDVNISKLTMRIYHVYGHVYIKLAMLTIYPIDSHSRYLIYATEIGGFFYRPHLFAHLVDTWTPHGAPGFRRGEFQAIGTSVVDHSPSYG